MTAICNKDHFYMQQAIDLAKLGRFTTTPNPNVGCVIVKDDQIIGKGYHQKAGEPHAEVHALKMAGDEAIGATAYVTLEPCSHFGRTPPCADALIKAGIIRVVIAMQDPNPNVAGNGIKRLKEAGIDVTIGVLTEQAEAINKGFLKLMRTGLPYIQLKLAASLDGKIAMASGESKWITSNKAREDVQQFRAQASCILSTRATVQADNASLTVRYNELPDEIKKIYLPEKIRQPIRVIIDSQAQLTGTENIFNQPGETWIVRKKDNLIAKQNTKLIIESSSCKQIDLSKLFALLAEKQINSVWVEAGAHLAGALIEQDLVDELIIYYAPKLLGHNALDMCILPNLQKLSLAPQFQFESIAMVGDDLRLILKRKLLATL
ncbi:MULTISPECIES: bifunctional diaminohydroxyphosphoribosylaminopyrimidine deaminase/5-amino-6-(5-phosphoribosylamino)uracil reductase RibD [unclassified Gilliamella]|uniref:bifunctional diaminohydroxyphosphoribosylaminopyrimidine deaminase/5-amino-6-(5-phosphoribosylamino)uracil reductase RibD n=1 Tax=unclassified Gilliamella TaxID=2685620 RepID=UPI001580548A|nr:MULTISPECIES: bifunctional diaminohydroxyphosphoribosylaminopyrimidine deaminase/5-amino-6-(5-phosphoribosylamino)uracil reductase RibD [unclassified Gilliamella]MCO6556556.1 bifunctional diaminohydroxyphosphoribosylaminopyrimidine deaminase/5-amino-6-(5-phosphoribosylamino)uracil reductase RibD [Gilliamella sp.]NUE96227.1 bifunctional diaminohydroxyphosphoribosylaminopyrimidine deaminase/5-amino-6-(5-phosphoribosylamino)uracil reductase RibD [Gilliamella sp. ESL0232]